MKRIFKEKTLSILLRSILLGYPIISSSSFAVPLRAETDEFNANWGLSRIGAQYAYEKGYTGKGIAIGVADSDFPSGISELTDKLTFVTPNKDGKEHNSDLSIGSKVADGFNAEDYTHGAHVSGIIGAKKNDQGMHGVAYGADIFAQHMNNNIYPFLDTTAVRLINNSWGTEGDKDYGINPGDPQWKDLIGIDGISTSTVKDFEKKSDKTKPYDFLNRVIYTTTPTKRGESKISITVKDVVEAEDGIIERNGQKFNFGANDKSNNGLVNQIRALREAGKQGVVNVFAAGNYNHYNEPGAFQGMPIVYNDLLPNYLTVSNLTLVRSKEITVPEDSETLSAGDDLQFFEVTFQNKKYLRQANLAIGKEDYLWEQVGQGLRQTQILVNDDSTKETLYTGSSQCGYTALWCVAAPGTGIYSSTFKVEDGKLADNYEYMTGTSMAAPHATGALAVLMERFPYMSSSQTVSVLKTTAADMDENGRVTDGRAKVIDKYFGWGKIDLENAIKGPAMFASADDVKNMLAEDVKQNLGDDLDNLANTFGNGDFTVNMGQGIKYDIGTTRERSCDAAECSFDTWSNNIAGSGGLIKKGSGTLQLSGNNTYAGNTFINEGGIDITGSLSSGIIVNKLGTLSGQGQSATIEINSGRFAPSLYNQTGFSTFTINGDIKFSPDATYSAKIRDKNEQVDKLVVRGNAYLNGANFQTYEQSPDKLLGKNDTLRYQGNEYTLMDATKINGIFNNNYLTSIATENIQPELTKTEEDKKLKLQFRDLTADKAAAEKAAADKAAAEKAAAEKAAAEKAAADKAAAEKTAADKAAAEKVAADKAAADKAAAEAKLLEQARAEKATQIASIHGDILTEEFQDMDRNRRLTNQRLRYIQRNQENSNNAWIDFSDSKSKSRLGEWNNLSNAKMHDYNVQRQGLALGADTTLGDWAIGITAAINTKDLNNKNNANAKIDNYQFGIYTGTQIDQINFRFSGTLGRNEVKSRFNDQNDGQFNAKYNGRTYQLNAEMGYALQRNNLYMEPFIGVAYDYLENDSIQQSNGYYSLNSEKTNIDRVSSTVGLDISQKWNVWDTTSLSLNASLAWQNRLKNNDKAGKLTFISNNSLIAGDAGYLDVPNNQNTGIINFGFNVDIANTHGFSVNYEGQFAKKYSENGIRLQYGYKF
ncbi:S8 family serine peptidase [Acinetobacter guillouiae]|uniref:S8 family serine peptidase n=1 Tax=Acinetobacter guillouiae TaxID=106649 RepID=UPI003AF9967F